ncbi:DUF5337 domain-containing protein [Frigidibacter oleivorans]|uniref:DUF5337 domain-containing protein n=1 Tax=Frigidibacter oleivorans TaxID=2487129 RepID=UPI000F8E6906|nr:DUF5337 domain-containing protein [Frigidibacter oleivorans]
MPGRTPPGERAAAAEVRRIALVIALTMVLWMGAQWLGGKVGLETRYVFLFDLMALAAFGWTLVATWRIWQRGRRP